MTSLQSVPCHLHNYANSPDSPNAGNHANILMLHGLTPVSSTQPALMGAIGHGQSMDIFYHKTHFLQDALNVGGSPTRQPLPSLSVYYSEAPFDVNIPGLESKVWGYGLFDTQRIGGLERSVGRVLQQLEKLDPVVGIVGFSTGATLAMIIASLLEKKDRCRLFGVHVGILVSHPASIPDGPCRPPTHRSSLSSPTVASCSAIQCIENCTILPFAPPFCFTLVNSTP